MEPRTVFEQLMEIYVQPAITRRQAAGELPTPLPLRAAQVICFADGRPNLVRVNDEVQAIAKVKLRAEARKEKGENVFTDEIEGYETIVLPETEDPDCGHATMLQLGARWFVVFDFRYNRGKSEVYLNRAREFLALAEHARAREAWASMVYVLFSAAELAARAELLIVPDPAFERARTHKATATKFNRWAHLGNVAADHKNALNRLALLRPDAGYASRPFAINAAEADALVNAVRELIDWAGRRSAGSQRRGPIRQRGSPARPARPRLRPASRGRLRPLGRRDRGGLLSGSIATVCACASAAFACSASAG